MKLVNMKLMKEFLNKLFILALFVSLFFLSGCTYITTESTGGLKEIEGGTFSISGLDGDGTIFKTDDTFFTGHLSEESTGTSGEPLAPGYTNGYDSLYNREKVKEVFDEVMYFNITNKKEPGQLTASVLFDHNSYSYWNELITSSQTEKEGEFKTFYDNFAFKTKNRIMLKIEDAVDATVKLVSNGFTAHSDANGIVYLFANEYKAKYDVEVSYTNENGETKTEEFQISDKDTIKLSEKTKAKEALIQLMFVIDTTGSMMDEMDFLKSEIDDVISQVKESNANVAIELALLFYRDIGDEYVTRYFDFTNNITTQKENLALQKANGGGDFEEAVDIALSEAVNKKGWKDSSSTKLVIHVADAPSHDGDVRKWNETTLDMAKKGIKVISVASSGIDKKTEYFFRSQSMITNGAYVYITDDSGIGSSHIEATTAVKPVVEYLNALLVRLINGFYTGTFSEPVAWNSDIKGDDMPEEMPQDFSFEILWGSNLKCSYSSTTQKVSIPVYNIKEETSAQVETTIEFTEEQLKAIYSLIKKVNIFALPNYKDNVKQVTDENDRIVLKVKYGNVDYEVAVYSGEAATKLTEELYSIDTLIITAIKNTEAYRKEYEEYNYIQEIDPLT